MSWHNLTGGRSDRSRPAFQPAGVVPWPDLASAAPTVGTISTARRATHALAVSCMSWRNAPNGIRTTAHRPEPAPNGAEPAPNGAEPAPSPK
jgi:hypothetical protein